MSAEEDHLLSVLPIRFSNVLAPNVHIHQYPLLTRPLETPPSARAAGKRITSRVKPKVRRFEVHVPVDTRTEVWNKERARDLGVARAEDDREKNQELQKTKLKEGEEPRLCDVRIQSERIPHQGAYMLGVVRNGELHLHPISETYQLRPTLTYVDALSRKSKRSRGMGDDSDSDDGPPPDPDEEAPPSTVKKEKDKKPVGEARELQVAARRTDKEGGQAIQGGLSTVRREMLLALRTEEEESWEDLQYYEGESEESGHAFEAIFSNRGDPLECKTTVTDFLRNIRGLQ